MATSLHEQLSEDLKAAMRSGDTTARDTIRFTIAAVKNAEIEKGGQLSPEEELALLQRQAKRRQEAIEQFQAGGRADLVEREQSQLAVLERYLPAALSDDELAAMVRAAIAETGASGPRDMGKVMPILIQRAAGRADGKRLSTAVRAALS
jgi:uncharacterized protein YqeY